MAGTGTVLAVSTAGGPAVLLISYKLYYDAGNDPGKNEAYQDGSPVHCEKCKHVQILLSASVFSG